MDLFVQVLVITLFESQGGLQEKLPDGKKAIADSAYSKAPKASTENLLDDKIVKVLKRRGNNPNPNPNTFYDLQKDARLVTTCPTSHSIGHYSHLTMFVRNSRKEQVDGLFVLVAEEYLKKLRQSPSNTNWLSTTGLGIGWVHFHLDCSPKYYNYGRLASTPQKVEYNYNDGRHGLLRHHKKSVMKMKRWKRRAVKTKD
jgi:hypothetical protein